MLRVSGFEFFVALVEFIDEEEFSIYIIFDVIIFIQGVLFIHNFELIMGIGSDLNDKFYWLDWGDISGVKLKLVLYFLLSDSRHGIAEGSFKK